jgi:hypothetical protein
MNNDLRDYSELMELENAVLFKFFGEVEKTWEDESIASYKNEDFKISLYRSWDGILISCDLLVCYNKDSQNPINFYVDINRPLSSRKEKRIFAAMNFLRANKKISGQFWNNLPNFDDLGQHVRSEFLGTKY